MREKREAFFEAIRSGNAAEIIRLVTHEKLNVNVSNDKKMNGLHYAAAYNKVNLVRLLLELGADPNLCNIHGGSPLHVAARFGDIEVMDLLLEAGGNMLTPNEAGHSAIEVALMYRGEEIISVSEFHTSLLIVYMRHILEEVMPISDEDFTVQDKAFIRDAILTFLDKPENGKSTFDIILDKSLIMQGEEASFSIDNMLMGLNESLYNYLDIGCNMCRQRRGVVEYRNNSCAEIPAHYWPDMRKNLHSLFAEQENIHALEERLSQIPSPSMRSLKGRDAADIVDELLNMREHVAHIKEMLWKPEEPLFPDSNAEWVPQEPSYPAPDEKWVPQEPSYSPRLDQDEESYDTISTLTVESGDNCSGELKDEALCHHQSGAGAWVSTVQGRPVGGMAHY